MYLSNVYLMFADRAGAVVATFLASRGDAGARAAADPSLLSPRRPFVSLQLASRRFLNRVVVAVAVAAVACVVVSPSSSARASSAAAVSAARRRRHSRTAHALHRNRASASGSFEPGAIRPPNTEAPEARRRSSFSSSAEKRSRGASSDSPPRASRRARRARVVPSSSSPPSPVVASAPGRRPS